MAKLRETEAIATFEEWVDHLLARMRNPKDMECPDCGRFGDDHTDTCIHRR